MSDMQIFGTASANMPPVLMDNLPVAQQMHQESENEDGTRHYEGALGKFDYDPKEYQLMQVDCTTSDGKSRSVEILHYIGKETDGSKIHVPEGLENGFLTFSHTNVESVPKLPMSLKFGDGMFQNCENLKDGRVILPPQMESASFMFANSKNMAKGPAVVPGTCKNASFMFAGCESLQNTPKLGKGVLYADFMFADCHSLKDPPVMPKSVRNAECATVNCPGIDATVAKRNEAKLQKDREKFIHKMDRPTLGQRMSSAFSAIMQAHALHQMGYGLIAGPMMVHEMRKSGMMRKDFAGGMAALAMTRPQGGLTSTVAMMSMNRAAKKQAKKEVERQIRMETWDRVHEYGQGSRKDFKMVTTAAKDAKNGLFIRVQHMSSNEKIAYQNRSCGTYSYREDMFNQIANSGYMDEKTKQNMSKWFQQEMSAAATYYKEGKRAIEMDNIMFPTAASKAAAMLGLDEISRLQTEPLMESADRLQKQYQLFNEGDIRNITKMMDGMPVQQGKESFDKQAHAGINMNDAARNRAEEAIHRFAHVVPNGPEQDDPSFDI